MNCIRYSILVILLTLLTGFAMGQVVNIEKKRVAKTKNGWQGDVDFALNFIHNTNDIIQGKNNLKMQHYRDKNSYMFFYDFSVMHLNESKLVNNGFMHIRYNYDYADSILIAEAFTQIQYNTIQKLQRRFLWGGGLRYRIFDRDNIAVFAGTSLMYEFELLLLKDEAGIINNTPQDVLRFNSYLSAKYKYNDVFSINHISYYQPGLADFKDYRMSSETAMSFKISKKMSFRLFFNLFYDSKPPEGVPNLFYTLNNGVRYSF